MPEKLNLVPDQASYRYTKSNDIISVTLDGGLSRRRKDIENAAAEIQCQWQLNPEQYQYFNAFYTVYSNKAVDNFLIDLILDNPFVEEYEARFIQDSVELRRIRGLEYTVVADLEVIPIDNTDFFDVILLFEESGDNLADLIEQIANYDLAL